MPESPSSLAAILGCFVWVPVAIWVYALVSWSVMGEIDAVFGISGAFIGVVVGVAVMLQPNPALAPLFLLAVCSMLFVFPALRSLLSRRELAQLDIEAIERAYEQLSERPDGYGPKVRIARLIYPRGLKGHAIVLAEEAVKPFPRSIVEDDLRQIKSWRAQSTPDDYRPIPCLECGKENPPGALYCVRCRAPFLIQYAKGKWMARQTARRLIASWVVSMAAIVGIPLAAAGLPTVVGGVVVALLLAGSGYLVFIAFRPEGQPA